MTGRLANLMGSVAVLLVVIAAGDGACAWLSRS